MFHLIKLSLKKFTPWESGSQNKQMRVEFKSNCAQVFTVYSKVNGESDTRVDL